MDNITSFINTADLHILRELDDFVKNKIIEKENSANVKDYVSVKKEFITDLGGVEYQSILSDLDLLKLKKTHKKDIQTAWLTLNNEPYNWKSRTGVVINEPKDINSVPYIKKTMERINSELKVNLNSCLVSYYPSADITLRLHSDNEFSIDQSQPICTLSVGSPRNFAIYEKTQNSKEDPVYSVELTAGSLCVMKAGCQSLYKHKIPAGNIPGHRYSLSFRHIKSPAAVDSKIVSPAVDPEISIPSSCSPIPAQTVKPRAVLILGSSITRDLIPEKLVRRDSGIVCFNKSTGGAKCMDINNSLKSFHSTYHHQYNVEKIFISIGTNDIRYCTKGVGHLKFFLNKLVHDTKELFPDAKIFLQSLLPIKRTNIFIGKNVVEFNKLIYEACVVHRCFYVDIFRHFLNYFGNDISPLLYKDEVHLNHYGIVILARTFKSIINGYKFNPFGF